MIERRRYRYEANLAAITGISVPIVAISAPRDEAGRTIAECQAQVTALETGKAVLFVDAHIRSRGMLGDKPGLGQILSGKTQIQKALEQTESATFWKIPGGSSEEAPARELLSSLRMKQFLEYAGSGRFSMVFVHLPRGTWRKPDWLPKA
jgi:Mrp family chromosome partitioning ATPase